MVFTITVVGIFVASRRGGIGSVRSAGSPPPRQEVGGVALRGGARVNGINVSAPFATLTVGHGEAVLRCPLSDVVYVARDEVAAVKWRRAGVLPRLKFETDSGRLDHVSFSPVDVAGARRALAELGWPTA